MKKELLLGNITEVKWHYFSQKFNFNYCHSRTSFNNKSYVLRQHPSLDAKICEIDETMNPEKQYAYVFLDVNHNIVVRNIFNSKHNDGFKQKNTFFEDKIYYDLFLSDEANLLSQYLSNREQSKTDNNVLYFCVEYEPNKSNHIDMELLLYCCELEKIKTDIEDRLRLVEIENNLKNQSRKKSLFCFFK